MPGSSGARLPCSSRRCSSAAYMKCGGPRARRAHERSARRRARRFSATRARAPRSAPSGAHRRCGCSRHSRRRRWPSSGSSRAKYAARSATRRPYRACREGVLEPSTKTNLPPASVHVAAPGRQRAVLADHGVKPRAPGGFASSSIQRSMIAREMRTPPSGRRIMRRTASAPAWAPPASRPTTTR